MKEIDFPSFIDEKGFIIKDGECAVLKNNRGIKIKGKIIVEEGGIFRAHGTEENPILFYGCKENNIDIDFILNGEKTHYLEHCIFINFNLISLERLNIKSIIKNVRFENSIQPLKIINSKVNLSFIEIIGNTIETMNHEGIISNLKIKQGMYADPKNSGSLIKSDNLCNSIYKNVSFYDKYNRIIFGELDKFYPTFQVIFDSHCKINGYPPHISYLPFPCNHTEEDKELRNYIKLLERELLETLEIWNLQTDKTLNDNQINWWKETIIKNFYFIEDYEHKKSTYEFLMTILENNRKFSLFDLIQECIQIKT